MLKWVANIGKRNVAKRSNLKSIGVRIYFLSGHEPPFVDQAFSGIIRGPESTRIRYLYPGYPCGKFAKSNSPSKGYASTSHLLKHSSALSLPTRPTQDLDIPPLD